MKILFITGSFPYIKDGIGDSAECLYNYLCKKGEVLLLTTKSKDIQKNIETRGYTNVSYIDTWNFTLKNYKKIIQIISANNIEVIHIEYPGKGYGKSFLINLLPIFLKIKYRNIKIYMRYHEFTSSRLLRKIIDIPLIISMDNIFVASYLDYKVLRKVFKEKIKKTYLGSSIDFKPIVKNREKGKFTIAYFGFLYKGKGIEKLLELMRLLVSRDNSIKLKMLCELNENDVYHLSVKKMISDYKLENNIIITGYLSTEQLQEQFEDIDVAALFFDEGLTLKRTSILSFIFAGIPIITSCGDDECNKIFNKEKDIFMSENMEEIVDYIFKLKEDEKEYNLRCKEILKLRKYFEWENITDEIYKVYLGV